MGRCPKERLFSPTIPTKSTSQAWVDDSFMLNKPVCSSLYPRVSLLVAVFMIGQ